MLLLADENLNGDIVRGLLLRDPELDIVRVQDVGLTGADDPNILTWAADNERIVLTHDRETFPKFAFERVAAGDKMPGVFIISNRDPVGDAIREILLIVEGSDQAEWSGLVAFLPL